ncbi:MAG: UDP-N-acetylmuramoyl-L-alanine--D-glutamate ligase, partial [Bdellovibrionota bacterium]
MNLEGQNITVVGLARAGLAAARFVAEKGAHLTVTDVKPEEKLPGVREKLSGFQVRYFLGTHPPEAFKDAKAVIVSPGVPLSTPPLPELAAKGVRVVGDVEFAA